MSQDSQFYTDVRISKEAVKQLRKQGVNIIHCSEVEMQTADDEEHLNYAAQNNLVIVSCDDDFVKLHIDWHIKGKQHVGGLFTLECETNANQLA